MSNTPAKPEELATMETASIVAHPASPAAKPTKRQSSPKLEKLSALSKKIKGVDETPADELRRRTLRPIVNFFIASNVAIMLFIIVMSMIEVAYKPGIVTDKVVIACIAGITIQTSSIIIAAFRGLFK